MGCCQNNNQINKQETGFLDDWCSARTSMNLVIIKITECFEEGKLLTFFFSSNYFNPNSDRIQMNDRSKITALHNYVHCISLITCQHHTEYYLILTFSKNIF